MARSAFWRDERRRLIATHPEFPDVAWLLELEEELAHAFALVLSRLPSARRWSFAEAFYSARRRGRYHRSRDIRAVAAGVAMLVVELAAPEVRDPRIVDLLEGAAQGHDLSRTPPPTVELVRKAVAKLRFSVELEDPTDARAAATHAVVEVLDPAGDVVALQEVVARAAWAAVESWEPGRVLEFLLAVDALFGGVAG